jgi:hypothetical protein
LGKVDFTANDVVDTTDVSSIVIEVEDIVSPDPVQAVPSGLTISCELAVAHHVSEEGETVGGVKVYALVPLSPTVIAKEVSKEASS